MTTAGALSQPFRTARSLSGIAPSKQESTTYEPSLVCKLLILGCRLLIPDRLLAKQIVESTARGFGGTGIDPATGTTSATGR